MHWNVVHDPQISLDAKPQVQRNVSHRFFVELVLVPPELEK
jgi:hypothetical protein